MKYWGIKTPKTDNQDSYIWWITNNDHSSWMSFFTQSNKDGEFNAYRLPLATAIKAYKGIGYKCVELLIKEKEDD